MFQEIISFIEEFKQRFYAMEPNIALLSYFETIKREKDTASEEYKQILLTLNYLSESVELNKKLFEKIKRNQTCKFNYKTIKKDKNLLRKYFDKNINPKNLHQARGLLRSFQNKTFDLAKEVLLPIQKDINFSLNGGSLIGALRHGGFIPWDDDIDFDFLRDDYDKLDKVLKSKYKYIDSDECKSYRDFYILMDEAMKKYPNQILCTDIKGFLQVYRGTSLLDFVFCDFLLWEFINPKISFSEYEKWWYEFAKIYRDPDLTWGQIRESYLNELNSGKIFSTRENCQYIAKHCAMTNFDFPAPARFEKLSTFLPYKKCKFEDVQFNIANDYNTYLARDYKDWQTIPLKLGFAKHIELYHNAGMQIFQKESRINYNDVCQEENYC